jgi:succinoglycan biosynthesis transport protein ExoP
MTTLPQTTMSRLPRPMGSGPMAVQGAMVGQGAAPAAVVGMTAGDVWRVIRAHMWLIIGFVVAGAVLGTVANWYLSLHYKRFTATGLVQVSPTRTGDIFGNEGIKYELDTGRLGVVQKTEVQGLSTDQLFNAVLTDRPLVRDTTWFKQFLRPGPNGTMSPDIAEARQDLADKLGIVPVTDTQLIRVQFSYGVPRDCTTIIRELIEEHLQQEAKSQSDRNLARSQDLNVTRGTLMLKKNHLVEDIHNLQIDLNKEGITAMTGRLSPRELMLSNMSDQQRQLQHDYTKAKAEFDALSDRLKRGEDPPEVDEYVDRDQRLQNLRRQLDEKQAHATEMQGLGEQNPRLRGAQADLTQFQQSVQNVEDELRVKARMSMLDKAQRDLDSAKAGLQEVNDKIEQQKTAMSELDFKMLNLLQDQDEYKSTNEQLITIQKQLDDIDNQNRSQDTQIKWYSYPETPDTPTFPNIKWSLGVGIFAGLLLSFGIAFARELMDQTVRSPRDITRVGQLNLLGMIPHQDDDPQVSGVPLAMSIYQAPTSMIAEQYRQVRTRLQQAASLETTRSLLVTSPGPGDGKSTVAANLAAGLALNGRRILLVDANFRRPQMNKIFNVGNEFGFSNVLGSLDNFETAVKQTNVPNLDILPTGPKPGNATELMENQLLIDFIEKALEEYDHVIFDSGRLLFVS